MRINTVTVIFVGSLALSACDDEGDTGEETEEPAPEEETADDSWGELGPEGHVHGIVTDAISGAPRAGAPVTEFGGDSPNSTTTAEDGRFDLMVMGWDPAQLWVGGEGYLETNIALTSDLYLRMNVPVSVPTWPRSGGIEWFRDTFEYEWSEQTGVVILVLNGPNPGDPTGISAALDPPGVAEYAFSESGEAERGSILLENAERPWLVFTAVAHGETQIALQIDPGMVCAGPDRVTAVGDAVLFVPFYCYGVE